MKIPIYQVDAFTDVPFKGNPAAVCPLNEWIEDEKMQAIAAENNLAETAFFVEKSGEFELRWFTPEIEVDLCGHATLCAAFVIFNYLNFTEEEIVFHSKSGILKVRQSNDRLIMDFPSRKPQAIEDIPKILLDGEGLGIRPLEVLKSRDYFVVFESEEDVVNLKPNFFLLEKLSSLGVIATAKGNKVDFVSRFFAPGAGVPEDPVTGSAHSSLIPYWAEKLGKNQLNALQLSERKGVLFCENLEDRVLIGGNAVSYMKGEILI